MLRIELVDKDGVMAAVEYKLFVVYDEASNYTLKVEGYDNSAPPG